MTEMYESARDFLYQEAELLDEKKFDDWLALFDRAGYYWIPNDPSVSEPGPNLSLIYDHMDRLKERVWRLNTTYAHAQIPESQTTHLLSNIRIVASDADSVTTRSKFAVYEVRRGDVHVYTGAYTHVLFRSGKEFSIYSKRVDMIQAQLGLGNVSILI